MKKVKTPCIGVCSTGIGDSVCRGCKRFAHEIIQWNSYTEEQKRVVLKRSQQLLSQVVQARLSVDDVDMLAGQCHQQKIRIDEEASPYCWVFDLLKAGASQIDSLANYGCSISPAYQNLSMLELKNDIDKDFFILSEVHYERYFNANVSISK